MIQFSIAEREQLYQLCVQYKVAKLYLFGSALNNKFNDATSDLDFLVELKPLEPLETGEALMELWSALENLFRRKIDLLTERSIKNPLLQEEIAATRKLIYDQQGTQILN